MKLMNCVGAAALALAMGGTTAQADNVKIGVVLPFSGADLMKRGLPAGTQIGKTLKKLQASWIRAGFPKDPATLARLLDEAMQDQPQTVR